MSKQLKTVQLLQSLLIFLPMLFIILMVSYLFFQLEINSEIKKSEQISRDHLELVSQLISSNINNTVEDLLIVSAHTATLSALNHNNKAIKELGVEYSTFIKTKKVYDQIRLLNLNGYEIVRVNYNHGNTELVPKENLQNKSNRYYYRYSLHLKNRAYYISKFDLNMEHGKLEVPLKPTLRLSTPVFDLQNKKIGIVVINYLGKTILDIIKEQLKSSNTSAILLDKNGNYILNMKKKSWQYYLQKSVSFAHKFPKEFSKISSYKSGEVTDKENLLIFKNLIFANQKFTIIADVNTNISFLNILKSHLPFTFSMAIITLLSGIISWFISKNKIFSKLLKLNEQKFEDFEETNYAFLWETDENMRFNYISYNLKKITGINPEEYVDKDISSLIFTNPAHNNKELSRLIDEKNSFKDEVFVVKNFLQQELQIKVSAKPFYINNKFAGYRGSAIDVTNYKRLSKELQTRVIKFQESEQKASTLSMKLENAQKISHVGSWTYHYLSHQIECSNELRNILGMDKDIVINNIKACFKRIHPNDLKPLINIYKDSIENHIKECNTEYRIIRQNDKKIRWIKQICQYKYDENHNLLESNGTIQDITDIMLAKKQLIKLATTDKLTGLNNRHSFYEKFDEYAKLALRENRLLALLLIDLDKFKDVNDTYGHLVGDKVLKKFTEIFRKTTRETDILARFGGDEFAIVIPYPENIESVKKTVQRIVEEAHRLILIDGLKIETSVSIGIAFYPKDAKDIDNLINNADKALYEVKKEGRNMYRFYNREDV